MHSRSLSLAARLHWYLINCSYCSNNGQTFSRQTSYNVVLLSIVTKLHIMSSELIPVLNESCVLWPISPHFLHAPSSWQLTLYSLFLRGWRFKILHISEAIQYFLSLTHLFNLVLCPQVPFKLTQMTEFLSFSWLNNIPLYMHVCVHTRPMQPCSHAVIVGNLSCLHI